MFTTRRLVIRVMAFPKGPSSRIFRVIGAALSAEPAKISSKKSKCALCQTICTLNAVRDRKHEPMSWFPIKRLSRAAVKSVFRARISPKDPSAEVMTSSLQGPFLLLFCGLFRAVSMTTDSDGRCLNPHLIRYAGTRPRFRRGHSRSRYE